MPPSCLSRRSLSDLKSVYFEPSIAFALSLPTVDGQEDGPGFISAVIRIIATYL